MKLSNAWFVARKDLQYLLMSWETLLWTFAMPVVFFYFIGTITAGFGGSGETKDKLAVSMPDEGGFLAEQLLKRLEEQDFEIVRPADAEEMTGISRRLTLPEKLTESLLAKEPVTITFVDEGEGITASFDEIRIQRAVYTLVADVIAAARDSELSPEAIGRLNREPRSVTLTVKPAGERRDVPTGFEQAVPGTMVMFTLLVLLTSGSATLLIERRQGLLRRLASTPIRRREVVVGKMSSRVALGLVQIAFAMIAGRLLFGVGWGESLPAVVLVLTAYAVLTAGLGVLLGSLARTEGQVIGLGVLGANLLAALGGCWWPIEVTPAWMQSLAKLLPTGLTMDALHQIVNFGSSWTTIVPHTIALAIGAVIVTWLATRAFRYA